MLEYRAATVELFGERAIQGVAVPFNRRARLPSGRIEIWASNSALPSGDALLNAEHIRGRWLAREPDSLVFEQRSDGLYWRAEMPNTSGARDAVEMVRARIYRGASVEFRAQRERTAADGARVIVAASVTGLALAARPVFADTTVEARGERLAVLLEDLLPDDARFRAEQIDRMAQAAGIPPSTVMQILRREIDAPPRERLDGFARVLNIDVDRLLQAATADGGNYGERALPLWVLS